jgi:hypothetical protein
LEHLSDQVTALASVARLTRSTMVIVTPVLETEERIAQFLPSADQPKVDYVWWTYSVGIDPACSVCRLTPARRTGQNTEGRSGVILRLRDPGPLSYEGAIDINRL